jgi:beta-1,4-mannosyl-glycoprotein beta-1,4-N-acetylglucosaminyltransferase
MHKKYSYWRIDKYFSKNYVFNFEIIKNGGWHFGWLKNINKIILKIDSYAHIENNLDINKNKKFIAKCINKKINFLNINEKLKKVKIDNSFPYYIKNNLYKFKKWIV